MSEISIGGIPSSVVLGRAVVGAVVVEEVVTLVKIVKIVYVNV